MLKSLNPRFGAVLAALLVLGTHLDAGSLPFDTVFKGRQVFESLKQKAYAGNWQKLPIGERTATVGKNLLGTPYVGFTLEIDDKIEAPSVNFTGLDCWTFFEVSLAFARMLGEPETNHTPETMLKYIELDRYRGGVCTGEYLSRLHYLEDWLKDNAARGWVEDLTMSLGGKKVANHASEMTSAWKHYRYLKATPALLKPLGEMEARIKKMGLPVIGRSKVPGIEPKLKTGDIIGIVDYYLGAYATSHVGLAYRDGKGVLRFMHASSSKDKGKKVILDARLYDYLLDKSKAGILVARPLK